MSNKKLTYEELEHRLSQAENEIRRLKSSQNIQYENIKISEIRYRRLFETAQDGILILDAKTEKISDVNPFLVDMLGYSKNDFLGKKLWEIGAFRDMEASKTAFSELQEKGYARYEDLPLETKDGRLIDVEFVSNSYMVDQHKVIQCNIRDITARKKAEGNLLKSEKRYRSLAENSPDVIMRLDTGLHFIYVNRETEFIPGIGPGEYIGKTCEETGMSSNICEILNNAFKKVLLSGEPLETEFEFHDSSGKRIFNSRLLPEPAGDGTMESVLCISRDITEDKKIKSELIKTRDYLNKLLNYASAPIVVWDTDFRITRFNHAFEHLIDYKAEEVMGKHLNILFPEQGSEKYLLKIKEIMKGKLWEGVEIPVLTKDGKIKLVLWNSANIYAEDGKTLVAIIAQGQDITDRKKAEQELEFIASFPKENPYPVLRVDNRGMLMFANTASNILLEAWNCRAGKSVPEHIRESADMALAMGKNIEKELAVDKRYLLTTFTPIVPAGYVNIYAMDITNRKQAEEEVAGARDELEETVRGRTAQLRALTIELTHAEHRERKRLAGFLHDNLQQLLVSSKWTIQRTQKKTTPKAMREYLNRAVELLDEAIAASKSLVVELSPPILHESGLVAALKWLGRWMLEKYDLTVSIDSEIEISPDLEGICVLLFQSVRELLFNVIKHSRVKNAEITISRKDDKIIISVSDNGSGFDPEKSGNESGSEGGFGLFSIRERLDFIGGNMTIETSKGRGACVSMIVPMPKSVTYTNGEGLPRPPLPVQAAGVAADKPGNRGASRIRVLIADDHKIMREGLSGMLASIPDIDLIGEAADGLNAVKMANELRPDIVIMDINMPVLDGIEATRRIRTEAPGVRVIGLSMLEDDSRAGAMRNAGAVDYLHKAGPFQELIASIRNHGA